MRIKPSGNRGVQEDRGNRIIQVWPMFSPISWIAHLHLVLSFTTQDLLLHRKCMPTFRLSKFAFSTNVCFACQLLFLKELDTVVFDFGSFIISCTDPSDCHIQTPSSWFTNINKHLLISCKNVGVDPGGIQCALQDSPFSTFGPALCRPLDELCATSDGLDLSPLDPLN